ncbi:hypothetical protein DPMN_056885 [Dreissena polymorpha]|uniref:Uncharacterized protein n=1 Tax=Dreissena polymorpha TaxID=45954 RepID=A0A9D4HTX2_DREPO|nr:hypothetical protein DPMN_056885 [Dreissena polymorpha]
MPVKSHTVTRKPYQLVGGGGVAVEAAAVAIVVAIVVVVVENQASGYKEKNEKPPCQLRLHDEKMKLIAAKMERVKNQGDFYRNMTNVLAQTRQMTENEQ